jgi:hypothetical protein
VTAKYHKNVENDDDDGGVEKHEHIYYVLGRIFQLIMNKSISP